LDTQVPFVSDKYFCECHYSLAYFIVLQKDLNCLLRLELQIIIIDRALTEY